MNIIDIIKKDDINTVNTTFQACITTLKKQFQSSNINFLLGAGFSVGVAQLLGDIEKKITDAECIGDNNVTLEIEKEFFKKSILPMADKNKVSIGEIQRINFFNLIKAIIGNRQSSILHKIVNVFTTNYDLLIENAFEKNHIDYIDGFAGRLNPTFSTANYGIVLSRQTSISSMTSEIVTFNLYKVHGSINWTCMSSEIICSDHTSKINEIEAHLDKTDFFEYYSKLTIVNPSKNKLRQTILDVNYYDQLRMFCNELEKNNTVLISYGFSFADEHITQMTLRALKGNPTFSLIIFSFNEESTKVFLDKFTDFLNVTVYQLVTFEEDATKKILDFTLEEVNQILQEVYNGTK